ncbi:MAG: Na(+)-translocating NADH-quinone reductase subunit F, partial [Flavobacteriaceae bacterium]|nr:Na(+)-translocating NADH-quinone reductase subunit F [Flavobacteriaceae bacterium]
GNILDRSDAWRHFSDYHGSTRLNYVGIVHQRLGRKFNGYSPSELLQIEAVFLKACGFELPLLPTSIKPSLQDNKDLLFLGLVAVVDYLCSLDKIANGMNCEETFDYTYSNEKTITWQNNLTFQN